MLAKAYPHLPRVLLVLSGIGLAISLYLTIVHLGDRPIECAGVGDCNYVNSSEYAKVGGVPVSMLGGAMYALMLGATAYWARDIRDERRMIACWALALTGFGYAAYLTYVELQILHAICIWCVASATVLTLSLLVATAALLTPAMEDTAAPAPSRRAMATAPRRRPGATARKRAGG